MSKLVRWSPFREMMNLRDEVDRMFDESFGFLPARGRIRDGAWGLAVDVAEEEESFVVTASVPGVNPKDLDITLSDNVLNIQGESKDDREVDEENYRLRERRYGSFSRSVTLPTKVNEESIEASCENGVLTIKVPKAEEVKPKRISVKIGGKKLIEG